MKRSFLILFFLVAVSLVGYFCWTGKTFQDSDVTQVVNDNASGGVSALEPGWKVSKSEDGRFVIAHPETWKFERAPAKELAIYLRDSVTVEESLSNRDACLKNGGGRLCEGEYKESFILIKVEPKGAVSQAGSNNVLLPNTNTNSFSKPLFTFAEDVN
jgi:hypothetical protein